MNALFKLKKEMPISSLVPFKYLLYSALLSDITAYQENDEDTKYGVYSGEQADLYDFFSDWDHSDDRRNEVLKALNGLADEGLIWFDDEDRIYLGEFRGKKFFPFEKKSTLYDDALDLLEKELHRYGKSKSAKDRSRARYIEEQIDDMINHDISTWTPGNFTKLHGYLYEIYTGGEVYNLRNKAEVFQTTNMLKAYDKFTTFALITEATLHYDNYRKRGIPTITNVACMKDDVFRELTHSDAGSKEYMREMDSAVSDDSEF